MHTYIYILYIYIYFCIYLVVVNDDHLLRYKKKMFCLYIYFISNLNQREKGRKNEQNKMSGGEKKIFNFSRIWEGREKN